MLRPAPRESWPVWQPGLGVAGLCADSEWGRSGSELATSLRQGAHARGTASGLRACGGAPGSLPPTKARLGPGPFLRLWDGRPRWDPRRSPLGARSGNRGPSCPPPEPFAQCCSEMLPEAGSPRPSRPCSEPRSLSGVEGPASPPVPLARLCLAWAHRATKIPSWVLSVSL